MNKIKIYNHLKNSAIYSFLDEEAQNSLAVLLDQMDEDKAAELAGQFAEKPYFSPESIQQRRQQQAQQQQQGQILGKAKDYGQDKLMEKAGVGNTSGQGFHMSSQNAGLVGMAIKAQMMAADATKKSGRNEGGVLEGKFGNDPWQGYLSEKLGLGLTPGEKFDKDPSVKTGLGAMHQWAYPGQSMIADFAEKKIGKTGRLFDPVGSLISKL